jgi:NAD(P)-dependent dehydrogenase (short-subunit alcohol dehydrogenase family)
MFDAASRLLPGFEQGSREASLQRRIAATEEIVGSMLYLVSDMASFTTGTTLVADGGYLAK